MQFLASAAIISTLGACSGAEDFAAAQSDAGDEAASTGEQDEELEISVGEDAPIDPSDGLDLSIEPNDDVNPIVAGPNTIIDTDINPRWPEVVKLDGCTGTVISPTHVLTAGHCNPSTSTIVRLDTPASGAAPSGASRGVLQVDTLSASVASGSDLALLLLDAAIPEFGVEGSPGYSVDPAFAFATVSNSWGISTVGYGNSVDCVKSGFGTRRSLNYLGGFNTYSGSPGVVTRANLPCDDVNKGPSTGDSGGPLLDVFGRVVGVFSGWTCRDAAGNLGAAGCAGTIEWTGISAANTTWLNNAKAGDFDGDGIDDIDDPRPGLNCNVSSPPSACTQIRPDFEVVSVAQGGCTGTGGDPMVAITVRNNGPQSGSAWLDVFVDLAAAPSVGELSSTYRRTDVLRHNETQTLSFAIDPSGSSGWVDAIIDSTESTVELDEGNNVASGFLAHPDCSFN